MVVHDNINIGNYPMLFFLFKQKTAYEMRISVWSSDVCTSDLPDVTRLTLLLASHSSILAASDIAKVSESELVALLEWAASSGDLLSRIGAIETGLAVLPRIPSLEPTILALVTSIRDLDPTDVEGRLHFLMGILLYVGGDISRTGVLADLPPFQRRLAIFAQAALFERPAYGQDRKSTRLHS